MLRTTLSEFPVPRWISLILLLAGTVAGLAERVVDWRRTRGQRESEIKKLVYRWPVTAIEQADPYAELGVFRSDLADRYRVDDEPPPYVRRDVDQRLDGLLTTGGPVPPFILLVGHASSGKSRTLYEFARKAFTGCPVVVPRDAAGVVGLNQLDLSSLASPRRPIFMWLDDLDRFLDGQAPDTETLRQWRTSEPRFVVLATIRRTEDERLTDAFGEVGRNARAVLAQACRIDLPDEISDAERARAQQAYQGEDFSRGIGEYFADTDKLIRKFKNGTMTAREVVRAAADWRRCGLDRPITAEQLWRLTRLYQPEMAREDFDQSLRWARRQLPSSAALLTGVGDGVTVFDSILDYFNSDLETSDERFGEVSPQAWSFVVEQAQPEEAVRIGLSAYTRNNVKAAEAAFRKAFTSTDSEDAAFARFAVGVLLGVLGRSDEAVAVYDEVDHRYGADPDPALRERVANALVNKGVTLGQLGRSDEAVAVYDEVDHRYGADPDPALREQVANALFNKGVRLGVLGRSDEAVAVYDEVDHRYGADPDPALREQVARARGLREQAQGI